MYLQGVYLCMSYTLLCNAQCACPTRDTYDDLSLFRPYSMSVELSEPGVNLKWLKNNAIINWNEVVP